MRSAIGPVAASSTTVTILLVWATASATFFVPRLPRLTLSNVSSTEPILILMVKEPSGGVSPLGGWTSTSMSWVGSPTALIVRDGTAFDDRLGSCTDGSSTLPFLALLVRELVATRVT